MTKMWTAHERLRWQIILGLMAFNIAVVSTRHISLHGADLMVVAGFLAYLAFGLFYRFARSIEQVAVTVIAMSQIIAFAVALALASYLALTFERPLIDSTLYSFDQALGFDWPSAFKFAMSTPPLTQLLALAYNSTQVQVIILAVALALAGQTEKVDRFLLSFMIGGVTTVGLWAMYPSFGAATYVYSMGTAAAVPHLDAVFSFIKPQLALQSGGFTSLNLTELTGVVGAPSFHTVMALVTVRACAGLGKWFWPVAVWNVFVVASVPVFGGHHLCDVLAGAAVAAAAIYTAERLVEMMNAKTLQAAVAPAGKIIAAE